MNIEAVPCILRNGDGTPVYGLLIRPIQNQLVIPVNSKGTVVATASAASSPASAPIALPATSSASSASAPTTSNSSYGAISTSAANGTTGCTAVAVAAAVAAAATTAAAAADAAHACLPSTSLQLAADVGVAAKTAAVTSSSSSSLSTTNGGAASHKTYPVILPRDSNLNSSHGQGVGGGSRSLNLNPLFIPATAVHNFHQSRFAYGGNATSVSHAVSNSTTVPVPVHVPVASSHAVVYSVAAAAAAQPSSSCELTNATTFAINGDSRGIVSASDPVVPLSVAADERHCKNFAMQLPTGDLNQVQQQNTATAIYAGGNGGDAESAVGLGATGTSSGNGTCTNGMTELDHFLQEIDSNDLTSLLQEWTSESSADAMFVDSSSFTSSHLDALDSMCSGGSAATIAKLSLATAQSPSCQQHVSGGECSTPGPASAPSVTSGSSQAQSQPQPQLPPASQSQSQSQSQSSSSYPFNFNFTARPPCRYQSFLSSSNLRISSSSSAVDISPTCYRSSVSSSSFNGQLIDAKSNFIGSARKISPPPPQNTQVSCPSVAISDLESSKYTPISEPVTPTSSAADADAGPYDAGTPDSGIQSIGESPQGPLSSPSQPLSLNSPRLVGIGLGAVGVSVGGGAGAGAGASIGQQSPSATSCTPPVADSGAKFDDTYALNTPSRNSVNVGMNMVAVTGSNLNHVLTIDIDSANGAVVSTAFASRSSAAATTGAAIADLGDLSSAVNTSVLAISRPGVTAGYTTSVNSMTAQTAAAKPSSKRRSVDFDDMPLLMPEMKVNSIKKSKRRPSPKSGSKIATTVNGSACTKSSTSSSTISSTFGRMTPTNDAFATLMEAKISEISQKFNSICDSIVSDRLPTDHDDSEAEAQPNREAVDAVHPADSDSTHNNSSNVVVLNTSADPGSIVDKILSYLRPEQLHSFSRLFEEKLKQVTLLNECKSEVASPSNACTASPQTYTCQPSPSLWLDGMERERERERKFSGYMSDESSISLRSDSGISEGPRSNESVPSRKYIAAVSSKGPSLSRFGLSTTVDGDRAKRRASQWETMADAKVRQKRMIQKLMDYRAKARRALNSITDFEDILQLCKAFDRMLSISSDNRTSKCEPFHIDMNSVVAKMKKATIRNEDDSVASGRALSSENLSTVCGTFLSASASADADADIEKSARPSSTEQKDQPDEKPLHVSDFSSQPSASTTCKSSDDSCEGPSSFEQTTTDDKFCPFVEIKDSPETKNVSLKIRLGLLNSSHSASCLQEAYGAKNGLNRPGLLSQASYSPPSSQSDQHKNSDSSRQRRRLSRSRAVTTTSRKRSKRKHADPAALLVNGTMEARDVNVMRECRPARVYPEENQRYSSKVRLRSNDDGMRQDSHTRNTSSNSNFISKPKHAATSASAVSPPHVSKSRRKHLPVNDSSGVWLKVTKAASSSTSDKAPAKRARRHYNGSKNSWGRCRHRKSANRPDFRCCQHCHTWFCSDRSSSVAQTVTNGCHTGPILCSKCEDRNHKTPAAQEQATRNPDPSSSTSASVDTSSSSSCNDKPCRLILRKMKHSMNSTKNTARFSIVKNSNRNEE